MYRHCVAEMKGRFAWKCLVDNNISALEPKTAEGMKLQSEEETRMRISRSVA